MNLLFNSHVRIQLPLFLGNWLYPSPTPHGVGDLHLPLHDGVLTKVSLSATFDVQKQHGYNVCVSLELHPQLPKPVKAMLRSRDPALAAMV